MSSLWVIRGDALRPRGHADDLYQEWNDIGIPRDAATDSRPQAPVDTDYRMGEFALVDPSGNVLRVGSPMSSGS